MTITVSGRPSARMVPIAPQSWRSYSEVVELFSGSPDTHWETDRKRIDDAVADPWAAE